MADTNKINFSDLIDEQGILSGLKAMIIKMQSEIKASAGSVGASLSSNKGTSGADLKSQASDIEKINQLIKSNTELEKEKIKIDNEKIKLEKQLAEATDENVKGKIRYANASKQQRDILKNELQLVESAEGSYNKLSAQYNLNKIALNGMSEAQRKNTAEGKKLEQQTADIYKEMNVLQKATGKHVLEVGNYALASKNVVQNLGEMKAEMRTLRNMSFVGKSPEEVAALKLRIGELMDKMGDMKAEMQVLGTEKAAVLVGGLKFIAAGVEGVVGALSVLGVESETIKKLETKMTSLIAVTHALAEIEDTISSGKLKAIGLRIKDMALKTAETVKTWAMTSAQTAYNVVVGTSTGALKAFRIALASTGIGLILIGIGLLIANWDKLSGTISKTTEAEREYNAEKAKTENNIIKEIKTFNELWESIKRSQPLSDQRIKAVKELNEQYPDLITNINLEEAGVSSLNNIYEEVNSQIRTNIELKAKQAEAEKIYADLQEAIAKAVKGGMSVSETKKNIELIDALRIKYEELTDSLFNISNQKQFGNEVASLISEREKLLKIYNSFMGGQTKQFNEEGELVNIDIEDTLSQIEILDKKIEILGIKKSATYKKVKEKEEKKETFIEYDLWQLRINAMQEGVDKQMAIEGRRYLEEKTKLEASNTFILLSTEIQNQQLEYLATEHNTKSEKILQDSIDAKIKIDKDYYDFLEDNMNTAMDSIHDKLQKKKEKEAKLAADLLDKKKADEKKLHDAVVESSNAIIESYAKRSEAHEAALDKQLEASKKYEDQLRELAKTGIEGATENLAFEQKKQAEIEAKKLAEQKKQKRMELGMAAISAFGKIAETEPDQALTKTITEITKLLAFINTIPAFAEGVIEFKGKGTTKSDSNLVKISKDESILKAEATAKYKPQLKAMNELRYNPFDYINIPKDRMQQNTNEYGVINEIKVLNETLKNKTEYSIDINGLTHEIVERIQRGNTVTINNHKPKGLF